MNETIDLADLAEDGDTLNLEDGRTLRLRIEPDLDTNVTDDEFYGSFAWPERATNDFGWELRPDGFGGNAEKLHPHNGDSIWWQPPADVKRTDPHFAEMRQTVLDLLCWGYVGVIVELCDGHDAYGRPIVRESASLWGIEAMYDPSYLAEVVAELVSQVSA